MTNKPIDVKHEGMKHDEVITGFDFFRWQTTTRKSDEGEQK
jgi:hypothetical protein